MYGGKSDVLVTINVEDANDEKPEFLERTTDGNLEMSLPEGNYTQLPSPGKRIAEIRVKDNDERSDFKRVSEVRLYLSLITRKPVFGVFDQVRHKPACSATEAS